MKIKLFVLGMVSGIFFLNSCNDDMGLVGPSIQPDEDTPTVYADTFLIEASTILLDSIYAKTAGGLLGELYDPLFGDLKSDYMSQFYSPEGFKFRQTPIDGKIDSIIFDVRYGQGKWIGDSLAIMQATVYPVVKSLDRNYYTNIDPTEYVNLQTPLGMQTYTARDLNVSDSAWFATDSYGYTYIPSIRIKLPLELGQRFYNESVDNPSSFQNQTSFNNFFPGLYVTNTFGSGNILLVSDSRITIYYNYYGENSVGALDSIMTTSEVFPVTKEVIQMNRFRNTDISHLLEPNDQFTYLKSPAGVVTRLTIPAKEIISKIQGRNINNFYLTLKAMPQEQYKYALDYPANLLLVPENMVNTFFEEGKINNDTTTFAASYDSSKLTYTFGNISNLLKYQMENAPDEDLNMVVIPVQRTFLTDSYGNTTTTTATMGSYLIPSGVTLRKDREVMEVQIITSTYDD